MRENRTYGSEGGEAKKPSLPLSAAPVRPAATLMRYAIVIEKQRRCRVKKVRPGLNAVHRAVHLNFSRKI